MSTYFTTENIMKRFFFLFGKTKDTFCNENLVASDIELMLYNELVSAGYKRIIFYSRTQKIYCYDRDSYKLTQNPNQKISPVKRIGIKIAGPLSGRLSFGKSEENKEEIESDVLHFDKMTELDAFKKIDACMYDESIKTAVIFTNAEDFIHFFGEIRTDRGIENIRNTVYDSFNQYSGLGYDNENIMLFVFPERSMQKSIEIYEKGNSTIWRSFFEPKLETATIINIAPPSEGEIRNAINLIRIKHNLKVKFSQLDEICALFSKHVYAKQESLELIMAELKNKLASNNIELTIDECEKLCGMKRKKSAFERLDELIGMENVKLQIKALMKKAERTYHEKEGYSSRLTPPVITVNSNENLHILLTGNPGTGKTTIAKLLGEIYYELGYLKSGHTVKVTRTDLVAGYVGQTAIKTNECIERAMGGVLFIDEAYSLKRSDDTGNDYGQEAIDTILEAMSDKNGQFAVIVAGYPKEMNVFMNSNPGLARRFGTVINIEDYNGEDLYEIFKLNMNQQNYSLDDELTTLMPQFFENWYRSRDENWGNAGYVEGLITKMYDNWCLRDGLRSIENYPMFEKQDIPQHLQVHLQSLSDAKRDSIMALNNMIGLKNVKERIAEIRRAVRMGTGICEPGHYLFEGNPGTGKTTVARLLGDILCEAGVLRTSNVLEVSREDLVAEFVGGTSAKTKKVLEKALDGILFVDEAYRLYEGIRAEHNYGKEALDTIVAFMENNKNRLSVIFAGYHEPIQEMISTNSGLKSRFNESIYFEDYNADELVEILKSFAEGTNYNLTLSEDYIINSKKVFEHWISHKTKDFGNARDVRKYINSCRDELYKRLDYKYGENVGKDDIPYDERTTLTGQDIPDEYEYLFENKIETPKFNPICIDDCIYGNIEDALVFIKCDNGSGSGFLISNDGYVVTCNHCVENATDIVVRIRIKMPYGNFDSNHKATIIKTDKAKDISLLKIEGNHFPAARLRNKNSFFVQGEKILLYSYPFGADISDNAETLNASVFHGAVSSVQIKGGIERVFVDMQAKAGSSGGPVISAETNEVIGVLCGSYVEGNIIKEELNYIIPIKYVWEEFLKGDNE